MDTSQATNAGRGEARAKTELSQLGRCAILGGIVLLLSSVSLNVFLAYRIHNLTNVQSALIATRIAERLLRPGTIMQPITAKRLNGKQEVISYRNTSRATVLYIFTPPCTWCARNLENFKALLSNKNDEFRFIGLSLSEEGLTEYVRKNELKLPVFAGISPETLTTNKLGSTPQTIVISPEGKVLEDWVGAYIGDQKSQVEAFFHVTLPGLGELQGKNEKETAN